MEKEDLIFSKVGMNYYGGMDLYVYNFFHCAVLFELSVFPLIRSLMKSTSFLLFSFYYLLAF